MFRKISGTAFWLFVFWAIVAVQAYSAFGQTELVGTWKTGSVGAIQYQDRITQSTRPGRGSVFNYKFNSNGTYEFIGYMETTMYNCTTTLFNQISGRYTVNGANVTLDPAKDFWKSTNSCAASGNRQQNKTPTRRNLTFALRSDDYGRELLCLAEGGTETCYRREDQ